MRRAHRMRRPIDSKSDTCTEGVHVDVADIRGKVNAHYPGRSESLYPERVLQPSRGVWTGFQKSAESIVGSSTGLKA